MAQLWKGETEKAIENFPISGERMPTEVVRMLARVKAEAARVNAELGLLDADQAERIAAAADAVAAGEHDDQFPIDVFQTGSGTSTNTNVNEVISTLAGEDVHPNDHVNMGQSSNDVFPTAVHLAALDAATNDLLPALDALAGSLSAKAEELRDAVKTGRTHLMDAVPVTLGQEFAGYAAQIREGAARVEAALTRVGKLPLGGTAVGTGLNAHPEFAARVASGSPPPPAWSCRRPAHPFEAQGARDALVELSGALKTVAVSCTKIANDIRWMGSGPRAGLAELVLPELLKGSSIMPARSTRSWPRSSPRCRPRSSATTPPSPSAACRAPSSSTSTSPDGPQPAPVDHLPGRGLPAFATRCVDGITANTERAQASPSPPWSW
jgi:fumarate hydratase class II